MKSLKKLRDLAHHKFKEKSSISNVEPTKDLEEITQGMQDLVEKQVQYDELHVLSSHLASRAHGFSESVQEMATFLNNTFGSDSDGDISGVFRAVAKAQLEIARALHIYASHVSETLVLPTEGLLNEIRLVEETKKQYDLKRFHYDNLRTRMAKGRVTEQQLLEAKEQFDEVAMFVGCRLNSLEQGRPRNILTQAARHHASQTYLFSRGLASLEEADHYIEQVMQERNIDQVLEYADVDFLNHGNDRADDERPSISDQDTNSSIYIAAGKKTPESISAPLSPARHEGRINSIEEITSITTISNTQAFLGRTTSFIQSNVPRNNKVFYRTRSKSTGPRGTRDVNGGSAKPYSITEPLDASPVPRKSYVNLKEPKPQPLPQGPLLERKEERTSFRFNGYGLTSEAYYYNDTSLNKRYSHSGPLCAMGKPWSVNSVVTSSGPSPPYNSGPIGGRRSHGSKVSPSVSPPHLLSPPRISELHKLPPPPLPSTTNQEPSGIISKSEPLSRHPVQELSPTTNATPLPPPPSGPVNLEATQRKEKARDYANQNEYVHLSPTHVTDISNGQSNFLTSACLHATSSAS